jgi:hypothetical protein
MIYAVLVFLAAVMLCGSLLICSKAGERDGICKYGQKDDDTP